MQDASTVLRELQRWVPSQFTQPLRHGITTHVQLWSPFVIGGASSLSRDPHEPRRPSVLSRSQGPTLLCWSCRLSGAEEQCAPFQQTTWTGLKHIRMYIHTYIHIYIHTSCVVVHTYVHAWVLVRMLHMRLSIQESPGVYWKKDCLNTCDWHSTATAGQPRAASQLPTDCPSPHTVCTACHSVSVTYVLPLTGPLQWNVM